jgi:hypothetical protein
MARRSTPRIFCLEGDWGSNLKDKSSVRPLLDFLVQDARIDFIYRDIGTIEELQFYIRKWGQNQYKRYSIGYFAFHGEPGCIFVGRHKLTLSELADMLGRVCEGKTIYFGSCSTLDVRKREMDAFRQATRARCVCGYNEEVDWFISAAFELLLFSALTEFSRMDAIERFLKQYRGLIKKLGFKMYK